MRRPPSLRRQRDISYLFQTGKRLRLKYFTVVIAPAPDGVTRTLVAAGRKIGKSVQRSRARRRLREIAWLIAQELGEGAWWIGLVGKPGVDEAKWAEMVSEARDAIAKTFFAKNKPTRR